MAHALPTEAGRAGDIARTLARLVGPAVQAPDDSAEAIEYLGTGALLAASRQRLLDTLAEATPQRASDLLTEWERALVLAVREDAAGEERRTAIVARLRAIGGAPARLARAVAALANEEVTLVERPHTDFPPGNTRKVLRVQILVSGAVLFDTELRAQLDELLDLLLPTHCTWIFQVEEVLTFNTANAGFDTAGFA
jgi:hypothetical protein